ncbi:glutathione S-transferase family protein [Leptolyngbya ohadii]|uniref:glutathione S-transferase family protein n=1 Tax=Leptolyngbya ohadii TaxID=1962290 RepID=UPI000B59D3B8|nr:glutathione S-transferase family protein [Leptolyngbya ohadii]
MLKLYGGARSRASIVQWYLEELGVPYEYVLLDMQAGQHKEPDFLAINPFGKVPAIEENGYRLWESGAILLYLSEKYDTAISTPEQRATIAQWVLFANATLGPGIFVEASREREMPRLLAPLNQIFEQQPFLLGEQFSAADVAVGSMLAYMPLMLKIGFEDYPGIADYLKRIAERPGFQKTLGGRKAA